MFELLYPAGTRLRVTRDFYPWFAGAEITLRDHWYAGEDGVTTQGEGSFAMRITADAVEFVAEPQPLIVQPYAPKIVVPGADGVPAIVIAGDGEISFPGGLEPTEAARLFIEAVKTLLRPGVEPWMAD